MRRTYGRIASALAAVLAAGVAGFSLRPTPRTVTTLATRGPTEVHTQVVRRTIHIVRHRGDRHGRTLAGSGSPTGRGRGTPGGPAHRAGVVRTGASGSHHAARPPRPQAARAP